MAERPQSWRAWGNDWAHYATGGRYGATYNTGPEGGPQLTSADYSEEVSPEGLQLSHVAPIIDAPSKEEAQDRTAVMGSVIASTNLGIDLDAMVPGGLKAIEEMTRVERKKLFREMVEEMTRSEDKATQNMGLMFGLLSKDAMNVKLSDHVKDKLEAFAKGTGQLIAAAAAAVGVAIAAASKKIGELWDKTKPAREKIASAFKSMVETIARVTKPAREKAREIVEKVGIELKSAAHYVGGKATQLKQAIANTALGKAISKAKEKAGLKAKYGMMAASAAIGAKLSKAGASMQESQKKTEKAAGKIQKLAMSRGDKLEKLGEKVKEKLAKAQADAKARESSMTPEELQKRRDKAQAQLDAKRSGKGK